MTDNICGSENTSSGDPCRWNEAERGECPFHDEGQEQPDVGRPSKLSHQRQEEICQAVEAGKSLTSAARMAGVDRTTVYGWIDKGEAAIEAGEDNEYTTFYNRLTRAKGHGEDFYFGLALELAKENEDHRFIASLMKQRYPDSWGDTDTGVDADTVTIEVSEDVQESWPTE